MEIISIEIYRAALVVHFTGIIIMAGTTFIDFITFRKLNRMYEAKNTNLLSMGNYLQDLQKFFGIGFLIILISAMVMMVRMHEVLTVQLWFRIKIGLLVFLLITGLSIRKRLGKRLNTIIAEGTQGNSVKNQWNEIKGKITTVQCIQFLLFIIILALSIFKIN